MLDWKKNAVVETNDAYHQNNAMSASRIKTILRSALHFKSEWIDGFREEPTPAMRFGQLCHAAILEPERFQRHVLYAPDVDRRTKEGKAEYSEFEKLIAPESIIVKQKEAEQIKGMIDSVRNHPVAVQLLSRGIAEHSFYFDDSVTGIRCKFRPDWLTEDGYIINLKSTTDASREAFTKQLSNLQYDIAAAISMVGFRQIFNQDARAYVYLAVEKERPWACNVFVADAIIIEKGEELFRQGMARYAECLKDNYWPGYSNEAENISLAPWRYQYE